MMFLKNFRSPIPTHFFVLAANAEGHQEAVGEEVDAGYPLVVRHRLAQEGDAGNADSLSPQALEEHVGLAPFAPS